MLFFDLVYIFERENWFSFVCLMSGLDFYVHFYWDWNVNLHTWNYTAWGRGLRDMVNKALAFCQRDTGFNLTYSSIQNRLVLSLGDSGLCPKNFLYIIQQIGIPIKLKAEAVFAKRIKYFPTQRGKERVGNFLLRVQFIGKIHTLLVCACHREAMMPIF